MRLKSFSLLLFVPMLLFQAGPASAEVEITGKKTLILEGTPVDAAAVPSAKRLFVLNDRGEILVYSEEGEMQGKLSVGKSVRGIRMGPARNSLVLLKDKENAVELINLEFILEINTTGSPYKGPIDAPVPIIVFSDFQ